MPKAKLSLCLTHPGIYIDSSGILMRRIHSTPLLLATAAALLAITVACGGGGGMTSQVPTPSSSQPSSTLTIATADLPVATMQQAYTAGLVASGNSGTVRWTVASGALPQGMALAADTGLISGTPTASGTFPVSVQAEDNASTVTRSMTMHVSGDGTYYHRYSKAGTYDVRVTTTDAQGNTSTTSQTVTVTQN
jgi:Putative Ig domain